jgi:hypothetical protein
MEVIIEFMNLVYGNILLTSHVIRIFDVISVMLVL